MVPREGECGMLHVTNGDTTAGLLAEAGVDGDVLPWRDFLHDGPVPAGCDDETLAAARADFIGGLGLGDRTAVFRSFAARDETLGRAAARGESLVMWFEDDLYDVLQLIQVLERLTRTSPGTLRARVVWLSRAAPVAREVPLLLAAAEAVTPDQLECAARAWAAFRAPDPGLLVAGGWEVVPHLDAAIERHLEQYPALVDGLDRSERALLGAVAAGAATPPDAFVRAQVQEDRPFLGDTAAFWYMARLAAGPAPLLQTPDGRTLRITELGGEVLRGERDWPGACGDAWDRWRGGVRLRGPEPAYRWDPVARNLQRTGLT